MDKFSGNPIVLVGDHLDIIYEDKDIIVINKAAGAPSQKAAPRDVSVNEELFVLYGSDKTGGS